MAFKMGIVGLPMAGKSTTFDALSGARGTAAATAAAAGHGREVRQEIVRVADARLDVLARMYNPKKVTPATVNVVDAPGLHDPHSAGSGLGKGYFAQVRDCEGLLMVIRVFESASVPHLKETVDPARDLDLLLSDLMVDDLGVIEKRLEKIAVSMNKERDKREAYLAEQAALERVKASLEEGVWPAPDIVSADERRVISAYALFTLKKVVILANVGDLTSAAETTGLEALRQVAADRGFPVVVLNPALELELAEFALDERTDYYESMGLAGIAAGESAVDALVQGIYDALGFQSFLTTGEDEVRAWTIARGASAVKSAGVIHSDLERGFIRAEVVAYDDLIADGSMAKAREHGHLRQEGRDYVVKDGDILNIKFSV